MKATRRKVNVGYASAYTVERRSLRALGRGQMSRKTPRLRPAMYTAVNTLLYGRYSSDCLVAVKSTTGGVPIGAVKSCIPYLAGEGRH